MALVLTRRPGEAIIARRKGEDGMTRTLRVYVVAVEGNVVRLALEAVSDIQIIREELLAESPPLIEGLSTNDLNQMERERAELDRRIGEEQARRERRTGKDRRGNASVVILALMGAWGASLFFMRVLA